MDILIAFFAGAIGGAGTTLFVVSTVAEKREYKAYMEGYVAGKKEEGKV